MPEHSYLRTPVSETHEQKGEALSNKTAADTLRVLDVFMSTPRLRVMTVPDVSAELENRFSSKLAQDKLKRILNSMCSEKWIDAAGPGYVLSRRIVDCASRARQNIQQYLVEMNRAQLRDYPDMTYEQ